MAMAKNSFKMLKKIHGRETKIFRLSDENVHPEIITVVDDMPVLIDDVKSMDQFNMTRASYFTIQSAASSENWFLNLDETIIPFYLLGISGIIMQPIGTKPIFDSAESIEELFDLIEEQPNLSVDTDDIWLPNFLFNGPHERGHVYRIRIKLFNEAQRFKLDEMPDELFLSLCKEMTEFIHYSEKETNAFKTWEEIQIQGAIEQYPKDSKSALEWFEEEEK
jgi:hypothetical protein